jgi:NAD(P) transhydrogenase subunit alpha
MVDKENGSLAIDWEDEIIKGSLVSRDGQLVNPALRNDEKLQIGESPS